MSCISRIGPGGGADRVGSLEGSPAKLVAQLAGNCPKTSVLHRLSPSCLLASAGGRPCFIRGPGGVCMYIRCGESPSASTWRLSECWESGRSRLRRKILSEHITNSGGRGCHHRHCSGSYSRSRIRLGAGKLPSCQVCEERTVPLPLTRDAEELRNHALVLQFLGALRPRFPPGSCVDSCQSQARLNWHHVVVE